MFIRVIRAFYKSILMKYKSFTTHFPPTNRDEVAWSAQWLAEVPNRECWLRDRREAHRAHANLYSNPCSVYYVIKYKFIYIRGALNILSNNHLWQDLCAR